MNILLCRRHGFVTILLVLLSQIANSEIGDIEERLISINGNWVTYSWLPIRLALAIGFDSCPFSIIDQDARG